MVIIFCLKADIRQSKDQGVVYGKCSRKYISKRRSERYVWREAGSTIVLSLSDTHLREAWI